MIPIRDTIASNNRSVVNLAIISANAVVFLIQLSAGSGADQMAYEYGVVPARYFVDRISSYFSLQAQIISFISYMFLHGGFLHLLGNMWFLYIFGDNVEERLGPLRYGVFYLLCGVVSAFAHLMLNRYSNAPVIGASGAVAGVMGAYMLLYPGARILTLIPIFIFPWFVEIPAFFFLGFWFLLQFFNASLTHGGPTGVAWWAHVGGFICGMVLLKAFGRLPSTGLTRPIRELTRKKTTPRLQVIRPSSEADDYNLYGTLQLTPFEAVAGANKLVNVPWGFHDRLIQVRVQPGMDEGMRLRLKGLGKPAADGGRGDLFLQIHILPLSMNNS
jgi:membrane associated rhomboid family serine protease